MNNTFRQISQLDKFLLNKENTEYEDDASTLLYSLKAKTWQEAVEIGEQEVEDLISKWLPIASQDGFVFESHRLTRFSSFNRLNESVEESTVRMAKVNNDAGYDFYMGYDDSRDAAVYNIVPEGSPAPGGGYYSADGICRIKGVKNKFGKTKAKSAENNKK